MMKTLYVSDLDGTLFASDGHPSEFTVKTINLLIKKGLQFTVATARSISSAAGLLDGLDMTLPGVMMNGVFLTDIRTKEQRYVCNLEKEKAEQVIDAFVSADRPPMLFYYNGQICAEYTAIKNEYEEKFVARRKQLYHSFSMVEDYTVGNDTVYISGIDKKEVMDKVAEKLDKIDGIKYSYYLDTYSGDKYFIEAFSSSAGKKNTVEVLKKQYGFDRVVAFGDNSNDVEMLKAADVAIVVGNAQPEAKAVADIVIDTNDNDGVAKYLLEVFDKKGIQ